MTERVLSQIQAAEIRFLGRVHGEILWILICPPGSIRTKIRLFLSENMTSKRLVLDTLINKPYET